MAVLKSRYVMLFFYFITQFLYRSYGDQTKEFEKSVNTLLSIQSLATGYPVIQKDPYDRQSLNSWSLGDLQRKIDELNNRRECGYLYSTQLHLKLTRDVILMNANKAVASETIEDFQFEKEALLMIDSLLDLKPDRLGDFWLLFEYTLKMRTFLWYIIRGGTWAVKAEYIDEKSKKDGHVELIINKRIDDNGCAPDNYFNMEFDKCLRLPLEDERPAGQNEDDFSFQNITAQSSSETNESVMNAIRRNKQLLHVILVENRANRLRWSSTTGSLWLFRDERAFDLFFGEFLAGDSGLPVVRFPGLDYEKNLTGIDSLGGCQNRVIATLKLIMLQITLSYTNRLGESGNFSADLKKFNVQIIDRFRRLMVLKKDVHFRILNYKLSYPYKNVEKCKSCLDEFIVWSIDTITTNYDLPKNIKAAVTYSVMSLGDVFIVGLSLVEKIQNEIGENPIRMVQSFLNEIRKH
ncbi:uncharacterized protein LOC126839121 [Adelges cooleyi]|uniref:uncharacterized protein LOC126839121 n=1 Tax=Adelges cooleyi TaxID=133065 RepID=UPI00217F238C|nr:uncharacterized protein LOC126839121 [Adelges cooleyi]XP_050430142.1 uncharacterized protein LOC126839121 [Adelges cooleyi]